MSIRFTAAFVPSGQVTQTVIFALANTNIDMPSFTIGSVVTVDFGVANINIDAPSFTIATTLFLPETGFFLF